MKRALITASLFLLPVTAAQAEMNVVATIKPVHSLVSGVMAGVGMPALILDGATSPHDFTMKPSHMQSLQDSDVVFWVGEGLEAFMEQPLESIAAQTAAIELMDTPGLETLEYRSIENVGEGHGDDDHGHDHAGHSHDDHGHDHAGHDHDHGKKAEKAAHSHDDHGHDHAEHSHDDHGHDHAEHSHDDHGHDHGAKEAKAEAHDDHGHGHGHDHAHGSIDAHIWLDPHNAEAMVTHIAATLSKKDPANAGTYESNASAMKSRLKELDETLKGEMAKLHGANYIVFHDAYQYFEKHYGLEPAGAITISPEANPGARHIRNLAEEVKELGQVCVFSEPQFPSKLVDTIAHGEDVKTGVLDPLGAELTAGPDLYFDLMTNLATSMSDCLGQTS